MRKMIFGIWGTSYMACGYKITLCPRKKQRRTTAERTEIRGGQITIGLGEIRFLIEELRFIKRSHESAFYYGARIDFILNTLGEQHKLAFPKPIKKDIKTKKS